MTSDNEKKMEKIEGEKEGENLKIWEYWGNVDENEDEKRWKIEKKQRGMGKMKRKIQIITAINFT